ncbi:TrkH family potassium uptake protein [Agrococcus sp. SGAir0287]|uniref:TrkH family potassium uptake protein n=1 Tax=Agrococcus sp. SGAir0287 TaxID=2070347 RepID=UPI0020C79DA5|nr:potassium transporter TrkG [Agrococcus sp. SGAir0287]
MRAASTTGIARRRPNPARRVFLGFVVLNLAGWALLALPISSTPEGSSSWIDALFTAVSAACVTGLTVVDTALYWTPFGQTVILVLVQLGGLGVMVFTTLVGVLVLRRLTIGARVQTASETHSRGIGEVGSIVRAIVVTSLVVEGVVALALLPRFMLGYGESFGDALWLSVFHAVSSYNNAGFALFSDNLIGFVDDPFVCVPLMVSTVVGGLGFPVIVQILKRVSGRARILSLHALLVLGGTALLLPLGALAIGALEWSNPGTLGALEPGSRVLTSLFHSVQTRTAGFNALDIGAMRPETLLVMDVLMLIGGGPAGTAGGIKLTTFAVLLFIILAEVRGDGTVHAFGRRLSRAVHREAITVALLAVALVVAATLAILVLTEETFDDVLFEAVSAFATVGLSTGITADLGWPSQLILVILMFLGRVGPATVATAIALRRTTRAYELPKERPLIG